MIIKRIAYYFIRMFLKLKNPTITLKSKSAIALDSKFGGKNSIGIGTRFSGSIGHASYIGGSSNINGVIGKYSCIGSNVTTISSTHPSDTYVSINPMFYSTQKQNGYTYVEHNSFDEMIYADNQKHSIIVGNDVWIGSNVVIVGGVTIGDGAIIATGAVVTKNVEPYSIVGGVPAKHIRYRFNSEQIAFLLQFKWWDKPDNWLVQNVALFNDIERFCSKFNNEKVGE